MPNNLESLGELKSSFSFFSNQSLNREADDKLPKGGMVLLVLQAILSLAALVQLWRTQMLPVLYLVIITALLVLSLIHI